MKRVPTGMKGEPCPLKEEKKRAGVVCRSWMRGLCKKDMCALLHEFDPSNIPDTVDRTITCFKCGIQGHFANDCPITKRGIHS